MDVSITAMEHVVLEVQQATTLFRRERGTFGSVKIAPSDPALPEQVT
ncbi:hypothetical protein ABTX61_11810 [Amycolatopsis japonica]